MKGQPVEKNEAAKLDEKLIIGDGAYWLGAADPQVTIVEFADFACSYCHESFPIIRELTNTHKTRVKFIFRHYPALSDDSLGLALAAECAGEQGLFWPMHDKLFQNQGLSTDKLSAAANQIGADTNRFDECLKSKRYLKDVQKDFSDGQALGFTGTPTWFINGRMIEGSIPYNTFKGIIEQLIKQ